MRSLQSKKSSSPADSDQSGTFIQQDDSDRSNGREVMQLVFSDGSVTNVDVQSD
ncbi:MAG: hypothetical protein AAFN12_04805 [Cyanobacteria bacterium J06560_2]